MHTTRELIGNNRIRLNKPARILVFVIVLCAFFSAINASVHAAEKRTVRVAFFPMDGYHITEPDGSYNGMDVEYLKALCEYADWSIEYVPCDSWDDALSSLKDKKVDLVGSAQYSQERAEIYDYADLASGYTFGVIATNADGHIAYEDFHAMRNITFGMVENYIRRNEFFLYLADNGIENPTVKEYESTEKLQQALNNKEIDALVHTFTEIREGQRMIGRFAPRPFYYISYKGNDAVMRELNQAVADLKINRPDLEAQLMNLFYYSRFDKAVLLTTEEKNYLNDLNTLKVGYIGGHYPFSYEEDGECTGLSREMLESCLSVAGLNFKYFEQPNEQEARLALKSGDVDILLYCTDSKESLSKYQLSPVREYASIPLVVVMDKNRNTTEINVLATSSALKDESVKYNLPKDVKMLYYDTQEACLNEVIKGNADAALCDGYLAEHLFRTGIEYEHLQIKNIFSNGYTVFLAVRSSDKLLSGILQKTITTIDDRTINEYMIRENTYPLVNLRSFIERHSKKINLILLALIVGVILIAVHIVRDEKKIRKLMYKDTFMDIWNLNYLIYWGEHKLLSDNRHYAVVCLNLIQFRHYNIIYGWLAGGKLLESVAKLLKQSVDPKTEICARNQGDRFVLLLNYNQPDELMERLSELRKAVDKQIYELTENKMPVRMGVYFVPQHTKDLQSGLNYAVQALDYTSDKDGNSIKAYDEQLGETIKERHEREKLLQSVDINKDFVAFYQPKVDIRNGEIVGAEALIRFMNPAEGGAIKAPGFFVPYYEQSGKITEIDFFVYESVCKMLRRRLDAGLNVVPVSCNFSRMHFIKKDFVEHFESILNKYNIDSSLIEIEITETLVIEELQQKTVMETLNTLHNKGIHLSIDDFGAGYSSLGIFEQVPASVVKLDRSFLLNQQDRDRQVAIMRGIVKMSKELHAQIVCEGVETADDVKLMESIGAYVAQGYYYSKPIPESDFEQKLTELYIKK